MNPVIYFEIPVRDLSRAMAFYEAVFGFDFEVREVDGNRMALFPLDANASGVTGALAQGEIYVPSVTGTLVYFHTENIDTTLATAVANGGELLYPKTAVGDWGFVAEFKDSEGNRIALNAKRG